MGIMAKLFLPTLERKLKLAQAAYTNTVVS